jgi:hypothetical protein
MQTTAIVIVCSVFPMHLLDQIAILDNSGPSNYWRL